jgi:hypothetical protein
MIHLFESLGLFKKSTESKFQGEATCLIISVMLSGCGSTEIMKNVDETYTVAAQYGSANGS